MLITKAIEKYGWENFSVEILYETTDRNKAYKKIEPYYIEQLNTILEGYNITKGGEGSPGRFVSLETREKISKSNRGKSKWPNGRIFSSEHKKSLKESRANGKHNWCGKTHTKETKEKMANSQSSYWEIIHPNGMIEKVFNLNEFCRKYSLGQANLSRGKTKGFQAKKLGHNVSHNF